MMDGQLLNSEKPNNIVNKSKGALGILLCDDDIDFLQMLAKSVDLELKNLQIPARIMDFSNPDDLIDPVISTCDIALLDIDFAGKKNNGIDLGRKIRSLRSDAVIIFVTNYIEYAPEGYEILAFRYIMKKDVSMKLPECLSSAIKQFAEHRDQLQIRINGEIIDIPLNTIAYIESELRMVSIYLSDRKTQKQYKCYASISDLEEQLKEKGFLRIHKSYLVNMRYIKKYQCHELEMADGHLLPVSAKNYAEQKKKYLIWKGC